MINSDCHTLFNRAKCILQKMDHHNNPAQRIVVVDRIRGIILPPSHPISINQPSTGAVKNPNKPSSDPKPPQSPANLPGAQTELANVSLSGVDPTRRGNERQSHTSPSPLPVQQKESPSPETISLVFLQQREKK
jgi:hypothetical protein